MFYSVRKSRLMFDCGCSFPIDEAELQKSGKPICFYEQNQIIPRIIMDVENIPDCQQVWMLLGKGATKGVFQLESPLGKQWTKKLRPTCLEHLSALGAILRPGAMESVDEEGISATEHYCKRKNGEEPVVKYHPVVDEVLSKTYNVLVYQEQAMALAQKVADFNLQEADILRKSIGKKIPEEMAKCKIMFISKAKEAKKVTDEQAIEIFNWIEKSQRYSFNKAHAMAYGINGYRSAYCKAHFPVQFYTSFLYHAKEKQKPLEEIRDLVNDAKLLDVEVYTPNLLDLKKHFSTDGKIIKFGLSNIKGIGEAQIDKLREHVKRIELEYGKKLSELNWYEFVVLLGNSLPKPSITNLISVGAIPYENVETETDSGVRSVDKLNRQGTRVGGEQIEELSLFDTCP